MAAHPGGLTSQRWAAPELTHPPGGRTTYFAGQGSLTSTARGLLLYTLVQVCRARVTGDPVAEATEDLMESTRFALAWPIGHGLGALKRCRPALSAPAAL